MIRPSLFFGLTATLAAGSLVFAVTPAAAEHGPVRTAGVISADGSGGAWTYDPTHLPVGARMVVTATYPDNGTSIITLHLTGAAPSREYGAHAHKAACTSVSADALGHFQFQPNPDPLNPTDPAYANPSNEVWLDLLTNAAGNGRAQAVVPWQPGASRPMSVVIHESHTATEDGSAGTAGLRLGCMTVPF
ncbi:MAG TPA: superoxide dismutase [Actinomycetes bacterium]|nr:superoxide dismutase [Actinomycetes bacterium]